jgi:hypothetical protein
MIFVSFWLIAISICDRSCISDRRGGAACVFPEVRLEHIGQLSCLEIVIVLHFPGILRVEELTRYLRNGNGDLEAESRFASGLNIT